MVKLAVLMMAVSGSAFAGEKISCELQAYKAVGNDGIRTSLIAKAETDKAVQGVISLAETVEVDATNTLFLYVRLDTKSRELTAEVRDGKTSARAQLFGIGVGRYIGELSTTAQQFRVAAPIAGVIADGFLKNREDDSLVEFDSVELICKRN